MKRNLPPYVQDFWQAGYKPHNYGYSEGKRFYKTIGDNDYFYYIQDKQRLKKPLQPMKKLDLLVQSFITIRAIITIGLVDLEEPIQ